MYYINQVIFDLDKEIPVLVDKYIENLPKNHAHFVIKGSDELSMPASIDHAKGLLDSGVITPKPCMNSVKLYTGSSGCNHFSFAYNDKYNVNICVNNETIKSILLQIEKIREDRKKHGYTPIW